MGWIFLASILLFSLCVAGLPLPQGGGGAGAHGQPQAGSPSTPGPGGGAAGSGASGSSESSGSSRTLGAAGGGASGSGTGPAGGALGVGLGVTGGSTGGGAGGGAAGGGSGWSTGPARRGRGWRDWRRGDPTLIKGLWKSKGPLASLGKAEAYIILALLIGLVTVVVGCWLSDNCWSPEPEGVVTLA